MFLIIIFIRIKDLQTIICMKWGTRYDSEYVNRLYRSIKRHTTRKTKLICFTDNDIGISSNVICKPLPKINLPKKISYTPWRKLSVWKYPLSDLQGDILFLDLDLVITGNLDRFFEYKPNQYCVIENWTQKGLGIGNTSCFRFPAGRYKEIFTKFEENSEYIWKKYHIEQIYISKTINEQVFWPNDWCKSFKHNLLPSWPLRIWRPAILPKETSIVAFTGKPDPDDVIQGRWPVKKSQFYKKIYKQLTTPEWIIENWS
jgi:hypothetical protein